MLHLASSRHICLCALLLVTLPAMAKGEDWPEFRGPTGQGISLARDVPTIWSEEQNVAWKQDIAGKGWSSPVIANRRIYLTTAVPVGDETVAAKSKFKLQVENAYSLRTLCLNAETGDTVWDLEVCQVPPETSIHPKNSHASGTPIVTADRVFVHYGTFGTAALDLDGNIIWQQQINYNPVHGCGGSPVLFHDLLIFNCDGGDSAFVIALDAETGDERWRTPREMAEGRTFSFSTPLIIQTSERTTLVSPASDAVYGYNPETGEQIWMAQYPNKWSVVPRPVFAGGLILVCTGYEGPAELLAIRPDGTGDVTETHIAWRDDKFIPHNPSPVVHDGAIYLVSDSGIASCRDLLSGDLHWKKRLGDDHSASPFVADGKVYYLSEDGACTVVKANPKKYEEIAKNDLKQPTLASIVPLNGGLLMRTETSLYRIGN